MTDELDVELSEILVLYLANAERFPPGTDQAIQDRAREIVNELFNSWPINWEPKLASSAAARLVRSGLDQKFPQLNKDARDALAQFWWRVVR